MSNPFLDGFLEALRLTPAFQAAPVKSRPERVLWEASDQALEQLRGPVYHKYLRKPALKPAAHENAIQSGLSVLAAFASAIGTKQVLVRLSGDHIRAISFQPRPFGCNWTAEHAISPASFHNDPSDPLLEGTDMFGVASVISTRKVVGLAGRVALALAHRANDWDPQGQCTFEFWTQDGIPAARAVWRSRQGTPRFERLLA